MTTNDIKEYLGTKIDVILDNDMLIYRKGVNNKRLYDTILWYNSPKSIGVNIDVHDNGKCQVVIENNQMCKLHWYIDIMEDVILDHLIKAIEYQIESSNKMSEFNYTDFKSKEFDRERSLRAILY